MARPFVQFEAADRLSWRSPLDFAVDLFRWLLVLGITLLILAVLDHGLTLRPGHEALELDTGTRLSGELPALPADFSGGEPVSLPDDWRGSVDRNARHAWYRLDVHVAEAPSSLWGVYLPSVNMNAEVFVNGEKIWISTAQVANKMLLLARTTPLDQVKRKTDGLTLFYTDLDRSKIEVRLIHKMGRHAVDSNMLFITDLFIPDEHRIGEEGQGFKIILHGLNPERVLLGAESVGIGRAAIQRAARYARERVVFGRPIGQNQGIAHPLAKCWAQLEAANLMVMKAATKFDQHEDCGVEANAGKYLAAEFAFEACHTAMLTLGGMGYAQEYHVERLLREVLIPRTAPVSPHMILNFLAEKVLELPKSY
jgi:hypothetical protein